MELTLLDYDMVHYRPSEIAAASLCLSQLLLDGLPWVSLMESIKETNSNKLIHCVIFIPFLIVLLSVSYTATLLHL